MPIAAGGASFFSLLEDVKWLAFLFAPGRHCIYRFLFHLIVYAENNFLVLIYFCINVRIYKFIKRPRQTDINLLTVM